MAGVTLLQGPVYNLSLRLQCTKLYLRRLPIVHVKSQPFVENISPPTQPHKIVTTIRQQNLAHNTLVRGNWSITLRFLFAFTIPCTHKMFSVNHDAACDVTAGVKVAGK